MKKAIVIPTYNEADNIETLIREIVSLDMGADIIVVDDNSPDGTGKIVENLKKEIPCVDIIHRPNKLGLGRAYIAGMKKALASGAGLILTMDSDFSHSPSHIPEMLELAASHDVVIGSRYVPNGGTRNWSIFRKVISRSANIYAKTVLGLAANDCTSGFRCYRREVLERIGLDKIVSNGYSFLVEVLFRSRQNGFTVAESPIVFVDRTRGKSKISKDEVFKGALTVLRLRMAKNEKSENPGS